MYNVLIVDDEPVIREGLKSLIPWEDYGFRVIETASDGRTAFEKYKKYSIDLMIVDIRMPGMDGLTLIQQIRSQDSDINFIILSGYADFEYAQKAITANVAGYLLKPVDEDELAGYLENLKKRIDQRKAASQFQGEDDAQKEETFLLKILEDPALIRDPAFQNEASQLQLDWKLYRLLLMDISTKQSLSDSQLTEIKKITASALESQKAVVFSYKRQIGILLNERLGDEESRRRLSNMLEDGVSKHKIICSLSDVFTDIAAIGEAYKEVKFLLDHQFFYPPQPMLLKETAPLFSKKDDEVQEDGKEFPVHLFTEKVYYAIDLVNEEGVKDVLKDAARSMVTLNFSEERIKKNFMKLFTMVLSKCSSMKPEMQPIITDLMSQIAEIEQKNNLHQLIGLLDSSFQKLIENLDSGDQTIHIKKLVDFIHRNYQEHLKLESLAGLFNYNSAYLGKLFKNHTGEYFNTYLDQVRIENAKHLLSSGLKVYQVAERVGYTNVDYFHNKFKKYVGLSPSVYRKTKRK